MAKIGFIRHSFVLVAVSVLCSEEQRLLLFFENEIKEESLSLYWPNLEFKEGGKWNLIQEFTSANSKVNQAVKTKTMVKRSHLSFNLELNFESSGKMDLVLMDLYGKEVALLYSEFVNAGTRTYYLPPEKLRTGPGLKVLTSTLDGKVIYRQLLSGIQ